MADEFFNAINEEIARLESDLRRNLVFVRWRELRRVRNLYRSPQVTLRVGEKIAPPTTVDKGPPTSGGVAARLLRRAATERQNALILARSLLRGRDLPTPTRDILSFILENGATVAGKDPVSSLSAMLSNSDEFESHGRTGWTYKKAEDEDLPGDDESVQQMMDGAWRD